MALLLIIIAVTVLTGVGWLLAAWVGQDRFSTTAPPSKFD
jgi:hypothetical protein